MSEPTLPCSVAFKVDAVLETMHGGLRFVDPIAEATGLPPTTVLRVAALLHDLGLIEASHKSGKLELMPTRSE